MSSFCAAYTCLSLSHCPSSQILLSSPSRNKEATQEGGGSEFFDAGGLEEGLELFDEGGSESFDEGSLEGGSRGFDEGGLEGGSEFFAGEAWNSSTREGHSSLICLMLRNFTAGSLNGMGTREKYQVIRNYADCAFFSEY